MMKYLVGALLFSTAALAQPAQQSPDPAFLQKAIAVLQAQRNNALDGQAAAEAKAAQLSDELAKVQARVSDLEKQAQANK